MSQDPKAIISAILTRKINGERKIFLQTRWKPNVSPVYSGMLEIPAGGIDAYENVYDSLRREVKEECGLEIMSIIGDYQSTVSKPTPHDKTFVFKPFICQQALETDNGLPWLGFVFLCEAQGEAILDPAEAKDPQWISISDLKILIEKEWNRFFPLQLPVIQYFIEYIEKNPFGGS